MTRSEISRRDLLRGVGTIGCSLAAYPALTGITLAAAPTDNRLVVIILRGGMDGLDVLRPVGDPDFAALRPAMPAGGHDLDGFFRMHDGLGALIPLWRAGDLAFAHAVSTPYRDKRSHFNGQDLLEAGTGGAAPNPAQRDGWLNRLLSDMPGVTSRYAYAIGRGHLKILEGAAPVANWTPGTHLQLGAAAEALLDTLYAKDPLFGTAASQAIALSRSANAMDDGVRAGRPEQAIAAFAADALSNEARIASFSLSGWDTHRDQERLLPPLLTRLAETILALKSGLGPIWARTTILAMTEFGRTARQNGSGGTDHGTGGLMLFAGGAINGGRVFTDWPGLSEEALYQGRDLRPTADLRGYAGWAIRGLFGTSRASLESTIFPGLDLGPDPRLIP